MQNFKSPTTIAYMLLMGGIMWVCGGIFISCKKNIESGFKDKKNDNYVGDVACGKCHETEYKTWLGSHHDLSMQTVSDETVLGDFSGVTFNNKGISSTFFKKEEKFFVNTEGSDGKLQDFEVEYVFGVKPLQQYLVEIPGGRYQALHTAWDTELESWFDLMPDEKYNHDDWMHWTKGSMTWNVMCADCHSTYLEKNFDEKKNTYNTSWKIIDVSCEACHGPGASHQEYILSNQFVQGNFVEGSYLDLTSGLTNKQQVNQCARCHSRRGQITDVFDHSGEFMDHYQPELIRSGLYHPDGQILEEDYVYGSFLQSKMYHRNVYCTSCHDPHSLQLKFIDNLLCTQCHVSDIYDVSSHHFHEMGTAGADCKSCHMPGKIYMGNDFRRDHSFRVPRPDQSVLYNTPNACNQCHKDKSAEWASSAIVNWYGKERKEHFSDVLAAAQTGHEDAFLQLSKMVGDTSHPEIIQATALWIMSQNPYPEAIQKTINALVNPNPIIRLAAVNAMENYSEEDKIRYLTPLLKDSIYSVRAQTAYILADISSLLIGGENSNSVKEARKDFEAILKVQADFPTGQLMKGQYLHRLEDVDGAEKAYLESIRQDPYLPQPRFNLAHLYYQQGKPNKAVEQFKEILKIQPEAADAAFSLGLLKAEMKLLGEAAQYLGMAAGLSGDPRHYYNWGLTLQNLNRINEAEEAYRKGIEIYPYSEANIYALAVMYLQQKKNKEATPLINELIQISPGNANYLNLQNSLKEN